MQTTFFIIVSMAIFGAMANPAPSPMGIEVIRRDGLTMVREVPRSLGRRCTNCVHVGGACTIGEGNCMTSEHASCTDCGSGDVICVDTDGGSCSAP
ncbi:MAG: hypothetical protein Q9175_007975 [Cornicularia normoerica]